MNEDKVVSIIIPVFNVASYLDECILSVINQTYKYTEIILVDDGSTDQSGIICDKYKEKDKRIKVLHKQNGGLSDARNAGLEVCKGDYISFVDSDDYLSPYFVEILMSAILKGKCDIAALKGGTSFWDKSEKPKLAGSEEDYTVQYLNARTVQEQMLYQKIATGAPFKIYKRETLEGIRFPVGYLYEDVATTYKPFFNAKNCAIVVADIYAYRKRKDSIIRQTFSHRKLSCLKIFDQLVNDPQLKAEGLQRAAKSRVYAMTYSVFLQVPEEDKETQKLLWKKLQTVQKDVMFNPSRFIRKKNKYAAWVSLIGMRFSKKLGRMVGQKEAFRH